MVLPRSKGNGTKEKADLIRLTSVKDFGAIPWIKRDADKEKPHET